MDRRLSSEDYVELTRLVIEAAWRTDHNRADSIHELFVDDGEFVIGDRRFQGRAEIRRWGTDRRHVSHATQHPCTNMRFAANGDNEATGTTVFTVFVRADGKPFSTVPQSIGEDHDRFVRTEQGWRFVSRHVHEFDSSQ